MLVLQHVQGKNDTLEGSRSIDICIYNHNIRGSKVGPLWMELLACKLRMPPWSTIRVLIMDSQRITHPAVHSSLRNDLWVGQTWWWQNVLAWMLKSQSWGKRPLSTTKSKANVAALSS